MMISTKNSAVPMAMATLPRTSGTGIPIVATMDIHTRICTTAIAMTTPITALPRRT